MNGRADIGWEGGVDGGAVAKQLALGDALADAQVGTVVELHEDEEV